MSASRRLTRRDFLKISSLVLGNLSLRPWSRLVALPDFPQAERLGRVAMMIGPEMKASPSLDANNVRPLVEDEILPWLRVVVGRHSLETNQNWVETPEGYVWAPRLQPVLNSPNQPVEELPQHPSGQGMWMEVSVPYVDLNLDNPPAKAPWTEYRVNFGPPPRLYYSQIVWVDQVRSDEQGRAWYRVNERYGSYGDIFWAAAEAFRPIAQEEITPLRPEVAEKKVVVDVNHQSLSCYEGNTEVYYCRISTGAIFAASGRRVDTWETPLGRYPIWRKLISLHMSGGTTGGGWDLPGIGWTSLFVGAGIAVHSTYWHNNFGVPMSNGCVNARPEDAKWVFRWTLPEVSYDPGDMTVSMPGGTIVEVVET